MMKVVLFVILLFNPRAGSAQLDLSRPITLYLHEATLEHVFVSLEDAYGISIAYGVDHIPGTMRISLNIADRPLSEVLDLIASETGLSYEVVGEIIVFRYTGGNISGKLRTSSLFPEPQETPVAIADTATRMRGNVASASDQFEAPTFSHRSQDSSLSLQAAAPPRIGRVATPSMTPPASAAQWVSVYQSGMFFGHSIDFHHFRFLERELIFQEYTSSANRGLRVGGYAVLTPKIYMSLAVGYATTDFSLEYNYAVLDPNDPFPIPDRTTVRLGYMEFPLTLGYGLFSCKRYSVWGVVGVSPSFLVAEKEETSYLNHKPKATGDFVTANRLQSWDGEAGLIFHASLAPSLGAFVSPGVTYFANPPNDTAMEPGYLCYRIRAGLQFAFGP